jgi:tRNA(fMet)-specific endonuclease VapC
MLESGDLKIKEKLRSVSSKNIKIPSIVKAELLVGAYKSSNIERKKEIVTKILAPFEIIPFDSDASEEYGKIRAGLEMTGKVIGPNDLIIAAMVLSRGGILVTNNTKEFSRIKNLHVEDWNEL